MLASAHADTLKKEELDQLLAPIALYPDDLLTNVLIAATYPLEVVQASRWREEASNAKLKGDALPKALEAKDWDPSIKSLVQFSDVLKQMSDQLEWTQKLGDAFLAQKAEVLDEVQVLRAQAAEAGHLESDTQQQVTKEAGAGPGTKTVYIIQPATPETVYVPVYQPAVVYGSWSYPSYPPYAWTYPGASFVNGFFWAAGVAVAASIWDWGHCDWHHHDIDINVNKWNNINVNRPKITSNTWEHNVAHRGPVPYKDKAVRDKFRAADREAIGDKDFRGRDSAEIKDRLKESDHTRVRDATDKLQDRKADRPEAKLKERSTDRPAARDGDRKVSRDVDRPKRPAKGPAAFNVKKGRDVARHADRGRASRAATPSRAKINRGGGGRRRR
ncbi:MAG: DUF3300 domain-containing protein [Hyphomicrobium sp.]